MITKDFVDEFRRFADNEVHPLISPDNWHIYSRLIDFIDELDESLKESEPIVRCRDCKQYLKCDYSVENEDDWYCAGWGEAVK